MAQQPMAEGLAFRRGVKGVCPNCGEGRLFAGYLRLAERCDHCGLDYAFADPADGPAFFAMSIAAVPALAFAIWFQFRFDPPIWAHLLTTVPLTLAVCLGLLRPLKGWLVCSQYLNKAETGVLDRPNARGSDRDNT